MSVIYSRVVLRVSHVLPAVAAQAEAIFGRICVVVVLQLVLSQVAMVMLCHTCCLCCLKTSPPREMKAFDRFCVCKPADFCATPLIDETAWQALPFFSVKYLFQDI